MNTLLETVQDRWYDVVLVGLIVALLVQWILKTFTLPAGKAEDTPPHGLTNAPITFYSLPGTCQTVASSGFCTKLNLYLRMAGVAHVIAEADFTKAPKGKVPYITHDGKTFADSQLIIRYLENTFDISSMSKAAAEHFGSVAFVPYTSLTQIQQATCDAVRHLCEGEIYWAIISIRWLGDRGICKTESAWHTSIQHYFSDIPAALRSIITAMIRVDVCRNATGQGLARHSPNDQLYLACRDITSLSTLLGEKEYFTGSAPTECDAAAFGMLDAILNADAWPNEFTNHCRKYANLVRFTEKMREVYFNDVVPGTLAPGCDMFKNSMK